MYANRNASRPCFNFNMTGGSAMTNLKAPELAMEYRDRGSDARGRFRFDKIIDEISQFQWENIGADEVIQVAKAYYYFSIQFRENLEIACRLHPNDQRLIKLREGECDTDNLSPWPGVAAVGERLNHDEFVKRFLRFKAIDREEYLTGIGQAYLNRVYDLDENTRAVSIASYEDGGLSRVFHAILRARDWEGAGPRAFKFFLEQHIRFDDDDDGGHGALSRHLHPDDDILPLWVAFRDLLVAAVPKLAWTVPALPRAAHARRQLVPADAMSIPAQRG
jgi:hypothetical protein